MSTIRDAGRGAAVEMRARIGRGISAQGFYARRLRFRDLVFDIGANSGRHTAAMVKRGARVVAVEPQAQLARALQRDFPTVVVLAVGVSDQAGHTTLRTSSSNDRIATVNHGWPQSYNQCVDRPVAWDGAETIALTTLDDLIREFGRPKFVKIDTEGLEDKVLAGLGQPVEQVLFEVHSGLPDVAGRAFERLSVLGVYEYRAWS
jgi:FkbM family methyltransferase